MFHDQAPASIPVGQLTHTVYSYVRDKRFDEAISVLEQQLQVLHAPATQAMAFCMEPHPTPLAPTRCKFCVCTPRAELPREQGSTVVAGVQLLPGRQL